MDVGDVHVRPVLEALAEPFRFPTLGGVIHLLVDGVVKFAQHSGPVGVLVELWKSLGEVRYLFEDLKIALNGRFEVGPLHLYRHLFTRMKPCTVDLAKRSRGDRLEFELLVYVVDLAAEFLLDSREGHLVREGRDIVLQLAEGDDERKRQEVCPRPHRLADLNERGAELDQFIFKPDSLLLLVRLAVGFTADEEPAKDEKKLVEEPKPYAVQFLAVNGHTREPLGGAHATFRLAMLAFDMRV